MNPRGAAGSASPAAAAPPLWLAPLRGVTLAPFRRALFARFGGVAGALAPFVPLGSGDRVPARLFADVAGEAGSEPAVVPQVIGRDPAALRAAAAVLRDLGFTRLNLNCGCPWKFVARKGRGSGLPEDETAFARMLEAGCEAMPGGFSVKIRLGLRTPDTLAKRAELVNSFPLEAVVVHPRTGVQMYGGVPDLDAFGDALRLLRAPVVYNGDVFSAADAARIRARFPAIAGIMAGRGLCASPWLGEAVLAGADPAPEELPALRARVRAFARELAERYAAVLCGPAPLMGRLKELWGYLHESFETGSDGLRRIQRARTLPDLLAAVDALAGGA